MPATAGLHFDLDFLVVEFAVAQLFAEALARGRAGAGTDQRIEHAFFSRLFGARLHILALLLADKRDTDLDQVADDLLDVAADIADLGEFGRLDLEERRAGKLGQAAGNFGFSDAGRADHQNILWQNFLAQFVVQLQAPPAVAQRDGDRALGVALADNVAVEFGNDFAGGEVGHASHTIRRAGPSECVDQAVFSKAGLFISANCACVGGVGIGDRRAACPRSTAVR